MAERLRETDEEHQEVQEEKLQIYAEEIDEINEDDAEKAEFICTCTVGNTELMKLSGMSDEQIQDWFAKTYESSKDGITTNLI